MVCCFWWLTCHPFFFWTWHMCKPTLAYRWWSKPVMLFGLRLSRPLVMYGEFAVDSKIETPWSGMFNHPIPAWESIVVFQVPQFVCCFRSLFHTLSSTSFAYFGAQFPSLLLVTSCEHHRMQHRRPNQSSCVSLCSEVPIPVYSLFWSLKWGWTNSRSSCFDGHSCPDWISSLYSLDSCCLGWKLVELFLDWLQPTTTSLMTCASSQTGLESFLQCYAIASLASLWPWSSSR